MDIVFTSRMETDYLLEDTVVINDYFHRQRQQQQQQQHHRHHQRNGITSTMTTITTTTTTITNNNMNNNHNTNNNNNNNNNNDDDDDNDNNSLCSNNSSGSTSGISNSNDANGKNCITIYNNNNNNRWENSLNDFNSEFAKSIVRHYCRRDDNDILNENNKDIYKDNNNKNDNDNKYNDKTDNSSSGYCSTTDQQLSSINCYSSSSTRTYNFTTAADRYRNVTDDNDVLVIEKDANFYTSSPFPEKNYREKNANDFDRTPENEEQFYSCSSISRPIPKPSTANIVACLKSYRPSADNGVTYRGEYSSTSSISHISAIDAFNEVTLEEKSYKQFYDSLKEELRHLRLENQDLREDKQRLMIKNMQLNVMQSQCDVWQWQLKQMKTHAGTGHKVMDQMIKFLERLRTKLETTSLTGITLGKKNNPRFPRSRSVHSVTGNGLVNGDVAVIKNNKSIAASSSRDYNRVKSERRLIASANYSNEPYRDVSSWKSMMRYEGDNFIQRILDDSYRLLRIIQNFVNTNIPDLTYPNQFSTAFTHDESNDSTLVGSCSTLRPDTVDNESKLTDSTTGHSDNNNNNNNDNNNNINNINVKSSTSGEKCQKSSESSYRQQQQQSPSPSSSSFESSSTLSRKDAPESGFSSLNSFNETQANNTITTISTTTQHSKSHFKRKSSYSQMIGLPTVKYASSSEVRFNNAKELSNVMWV